MTTKSPTLYSSIPTSTNPTPSTPNTRLHFLSRASAQLSARRPWRQLLDPTTVSLPYTYSESLSRIRRNISYFRVNYTLLLLVILFLSLIYHPVSMIVFLMIFSAWLVLYFFRDAPIFLFGRMVNENVVLGVLGFVTVVGLVLTDVGLNVFVSLVIGVVVVGLHAGFRGTEDLFLDENEVAEGGLLSVVGGEPLRSSYTQLD